MQNIFIGVISLLASYNYDDFIVNKPQEDYELRVSCGVNSYRESIIAAQLKVTQNSCSGCKIKKINAGASFVAIGADSVFRGHWIAGKVTAKIIDGGKACMSFQPNQLVEVVLKNGSELVYFGEPCMTILYDSSCTVRKGNLLDLFDWYRS